MLPLASHMMMRGRHWGGGGDGWGKAEGEGWREGRAEEEVAEEEVGTLGKAERCNNGSERQNRQEEAAMTGRALWIDCQ